MIKGQQGWIWGRSVSSDLKSRKVMIKVGNWKKSEKLDLKKKVIRSSDISVVLEIPGKLNKVIRNLRNWKSVYKKCGKLTLTVNKVEWAVNFDLASHPRTLFELLYAPLAGRLLMCIFCIRALNPGDGLFVLFCTWNRWDRESGSCKLFSRQVFKLQFGWILTCHSFLIYIHTCITKYQKYLQNCDVFVNISFKLSTV